MKTITTIVCLLCCATAIGAIPSTLPYQGRIANNGSLPTGSHHFKFAIVDHATTPTVSYWSNDLTSTAGSEPSTSHVIAITNGLFNVTFGEGGASNAAIPSTVWENDNLILQVWYSETGAPGTFSSIDSVSIQPVAHAHRASVADSLAAGVSVNDADADPTNELQTLSVNGGSLSIDGGTTNVNLSSAVNTILDASSGLGVGLNGNAPDAALHINGNTGYKVFQGLSNSAEIRNGSFMTGSLGGSFAVTVVGNNAYIAGSNSLLIFDISALDGAGPSELVRINDGSTSDFDKLSLIRDIDIVGNFAYVGSFGDDAVTIIDVSDPANPSLVSKLEDNVNGFNHLAGAFKIAVSGDYAFVSSINENAVSVVNISDPFNPQLVTVIEDGVGGFDQLAGARDVSIANDLLYVTAFDDDALTIIDVSTPSVPVKLAELVDGVNGFDYLDAAFDVEVIGDYAFVTGRDDSAINIIDVSIPTSPTLVTVIRDGVNGFDRLSLASEMKIVDDIIYVTAQLDNALTLIDISDKQNPELIAALVDGNNGYNRLALPYAVEVSGDYIYVTSGADDTVTIIEQTIDAITVDLIAQNRIGIGTSQPSAELHVDGDAFVTGSLLDSSQQAGTNGQILTTTGTGTEWATLDVNDADADPFNELLTEVALDGNTLKLTDAGGTASVDLGAISFLPETIDGSAIKQETLFGGAVDIAISESTDLYGVKVIAARSTDNQFFIYSDDGNSSACHWLDASNPNELKINDSTPISNVLGMAVSSSHDYLCMVDDTGVVYTLPLNFSQKSFGDFLPEFAFAPNNSSPTSLVDIAITDDRLVLIYSEGAVVILELSEDGEVLGTKRNFAYFDYHYYAADIDSSGNYVIAVGRDVHTNNGADIVDIYNLSGGGLLTNLSSYEDDRNESYPGFDLFVGELEVEVVGELVYVAAEGSNSIAIFSSENIRDFTLLGYLIDEDFFDDSVALVVRDEIAYVATIDGVTRVDVSDSTSPEIVDRITGEEFASISAFVYSKDVIMTGSETNGVTSGFQAVDLVDPSAALQVSRALIAAELHVAGDAFVTGSLLDSSQQAGTSGQVLTTSGTGTEWANLNISNIGAGTFANDGNIQLNRGQKLNVQEWETDNGLFALPQLNLDGSPSGVTFGNAPNLKGNTANDPAASNISGNNQVVLTSGAGGILGSVTGGDEIPALAWYKSGDVRFFGNIELRDIESDLILHSKQHSGGLGMYDNATRKFGDNTVTGPVLYSPFGGALGTTIGGNRLLALRWQTKGHSGVEPIVFIEGDTVFGGDAFFGGNVIRLSSGANQNYIRWLTADNPFGDHSPGIGNGNGGMLLVGKQGGIIGTDNGSTEAIAMRWWENARVSFGDDSVATQTIVTITGQAFPTTVGTTDDLADHLLNVRTSDLTEVLVVNEDNTVDITNLNVTGTATLPAGGINGSAIENGSIEQADLAQFAYTRPFYVSRNNGVYFEGDIGGFQTVPPEINQIGIESIRDESNTGEFGGLSFPGVSVFGTQGGVLGSRVLGTSDYAESIALRWYSGHRASFGAHVIDGNTLVNIRGRNEEPQTSDIDGGGDDPDPYPNIFRIQTSDGTDLLIAKEEGVVQVSNVSITGVISTPLLQGTKITSNDITVDSNKVITYTSETDQVYTLAGRVESDGTLSHLTSTITLSPGPSVTRTATGRYTFSLNRTQVSNLIPTVTPMGANRSAAITSINTSNGNEGFTVEINSHNNNRQDTPFTFMLMWTE